MMFEGHVYFSTIAAFLLVLLLTPVVIHLAHKMEWLATPTKDRWHEKAVALSGGIAIFASVALALLFHPVSFLSWIWIGASVMFVVGVLDDHLHLSPFIKLLTQLLAASLLLFAGYELLPSLPVWISAGITLFWIIGITNAVNMLDNMDGLSSGVTAISLLVLGLLLLINGDPLHGIISLTITGALLGFLFYNFKPARIFMGDGGSLFLGYMLAGLVLALITSLPEMDGWMALCIGVGLAAVPIFDTTLVTINRLLNGISPMKGGKDHSSHRLVLLGLSETSTVLLLYVISLIGCITVLLSFYVEPSSFLLMFLITMFSLFLLGKHLSNLVVYSPVKKKRDAKFFSLPD